MNEKLLETFDQNIRGKFCYLASHNKNMAVKTMGDMVLIDSGFNSNMFNIICSSGVPDRAAVKSAIDHYRMKKLPYAFWIGFESDPAWLEDELINYGLVTDEMELAMICDLDKFEPIQRNFDIRQAQDVQDVITVMNGILPKEEHAAIRSFYEQSGSILLSQDCPLTFFVGYVNNKPVSISSSFCEKGIASIFDVIVLPEFRGKGLGLAMTSIAMLKAKAKGITSCVLTATNDAKYLYKKLGFEDLKTMKVYHE